MRLLFDHNLSHRLARRLQDLFPGTTHPRMLGLAQAPNWALWELRDKAASRFGATGKFCRRGPKRDAPPDPREVDKVRWRAA